MGKSNDIDYVFHRFGELQKQVVDAERRAAYAEGQLEEVRAELARLRAVEVGAEPMTLRQAADAIGVCYRTATEFVKDGRLRAYKAGRFWRVDPDAVRDFKATQATGGS